MNKKFKLLLPSICMMLVSAMLVGTSTFAWFSMNTTVTASNMQVQARAEDGLLISEVAAAGIENWDNEATTNQTTGIQLRATSTADTKTWYVAYLSV